MKNNSIFFLFSVLALFSCENKIQESQKENENTFVRSPVDYVNPLIGTAPLTDPKFIGYTPPEGWRVWAGLTYPGSTLPNAMVQLSPITEYHTGAGYEYEDDTILGFTHTNKGHWNLCNIPVLPVSGEAEAPFKSVFSHDTEKASPAYYEVVLEDYGVKARLTSTLRAGVHEYTFESNKERKILFDLAKANNRVNHWELTQEGDSAVAGFQDMGREKIYFYAEINQKIAQIDQKTGENGHALVKITDSENDPIVLKIGLSYVNVENAKANLKAEVGNKSFDEVHEAGVAEWEEILNKIKVKGGSEKQKELFYSSLYRFMQWPALRSDTNGDFTDEAGKVQNKNFKYYTNPSLWDTYRNKLVLLAMLRPEVTADVIQSLIDKGEITGFIPTFFHGDHAAPFIAGSYLMGIDGFDVDKAYELLLNNAYKEGGTRPHIKEYIEKGYISTPEIKNPNTESKAKAGVSKTLEFAYDDYSLALLAEKMKDSVHYNDLKQRSQNYKNVFDKKSHFMRGRMANGEFVNLFDAEYPYYEYMYREANAWQLSFYVPHDMPGLVQLYGGNEKFEEKLDSLFTYPWNPEHIARNISSFIGQYAHGNQPDHEAPFSYYFIDKPEKSQKIIDTILNHYYGVGEDGLALPGMDDAGEMSAWYVFAAAGIYPLSPADNKLLVTIPVFDESKWNLNGNEVMITKKGNTRQLDSIKINGKSLEGYFISQELFKTGGTLDISTKELSGN
ncbi:GH92 family glycosyl hydrolase [Flavimarina sp. Hel_I_48]|uniref:GH92 family glycosyl hydrolase n=1 Tax=Flavimarina sp. Hel_I_48 TaxID=1392488 RepID=UPI0004DEF69E|nr:GH92 family glycosyl hydrolase [Flavimarina sp. Hel_I_48]